MAQDVLQLGPLCLRLVGHDDPVVAPLPERSPPLADPAADLFRDVASQVLHEAGKLLLALDDCERVQMVAEDDQQRRARVQCFSGS